MNEKIKKLKKLKSFLIKAIKNDFMLDSYDNFSAEINEEANVVELYENRDSGSLIRSEVIAELIKHEHGLNIIIRYDKKTEQCYYEIYIDRY